jgi:hypothetical protein
MATLGQLVIEIAANSAQFRSELESARGEFAKFTGGIKTGLQALGVATSLTGLAYMAKSAIDTGVEIQKMSTRLSMGTKTLQEFQFIARATGASMGDLEVAIRNMNRQFAAAAQDSPEALQLLHMVGMGAKTSGGDVRTFANSIEQFAVAFQHTLNPAQQAEVSFKTFGRGAQDIRLILKALADEGFAKFAEEAAKAGQVLDDQTLESLKRAHDAFERTTSSIKIGFMEAVAAIGPALENTANILTKTAHIVRDLTSAVDDYIKTALRTPEAEMTFGQAAANVINRIGGTHKLTPEERADMERYYAMPARQGLLGTGPITSRPMSTGQPWAQGPYSLNIPQTPTPYIGGPKFESPLYSLAGPGMVTTGVIETIANQVKRLEEQMQGELSALEVAQAKSRARLAGTGPEGQIADLLEQKKAISANLEVEKRYTSAIAATKLSEEAKTEAIAKNAKSTADATVKQIALDTQLADVRLQLIQRSTAVEAELGVFVKDALHNVDELIVKEKDRFKAHDLEIKDAITAERFMGDQFLAVSTEIAQKEAQLRERTSVTSLVPGSGPQFLDTGEGKQLVADIDAKRVELVTTQLGKQLRDIGAQSALLGDQFDAAGARVQAFQGALLALAKMKNVSPEVLEDLLNKLTLARPEAVLEGVRKQFQEIGDASQFMGVQFDAVAPKIAAVQAALAKLYSLRNLSPQEAAAVGKQIDALTGQLTTLRPQQIQGSYERQQMTIANSAKNLGVTYDALGADIQSTTQALEAFAAQGVTTGVEVDRLKDKLTNLTAIQFGVSAVFDGLRTAFSGALQGILQGTQTMQQAFSNMGRNIAASLVESVINQGLKVVENALKNFLEEAQKSGLWAALLKLLGGVGSFFGPSSTTTTDTGTGSGFGDQVSGPVFSPEQQHGGIFSRRTHVIVGEAGPEAIIPLSHHNATMTLHHYAKGGVARWPQHAMVGEAGAEAIVPLSSGHNIPVKFVGGSPQGPAALGRVQSGPLVTVIVENNAPNTTVDRKKSTGPNGQEIHRIIIGEVQKGFETGEFDRTMGIFGASRQPVGR